MLKPCRTKNFKGKSYRCFFELTLLVIGGKWKPIILNHLSLIDIMRFSDLRRSVLGITERMLTRQLRELEDDGLIHREIYREVPPRVEYSLTDTGRSLIPILEAMRAWGADYERDHGGVDYPPELGYEAREHPCPSGTRDDSEPKRQAG